MKTKNVKIKGVLLVVFIVFASFASLFALSSLTRGTSTFELKTFSSYNELTDFLKINNERFTSYNNEYYSVSPTIRLSKSDGIGAAESPESLDFDDVDYSETNIQVEGVDEPDVVKTDGTYLYVIANQKVYIIKAYPVQKAVIVSELTFDDDVYINNLFINNDRLIIFGNSNRYPFEYDDVYWNSISTTSVFIYDIKQKNNPELLRDITLDGSYFDSRMIGDYIYVISTEYTYNIYRTIDGNISICIPEITINDEIRKIPSDQIYYVDIPEQINSMTYVVSISIYKDEVNHKTFLLGGSQTMFVSKDNIFLAYTNYNYYPWFMNDVVNEEKTILHKINIKAGDISYAAQGEVPGHVLNQFSMDEYQNYFRVATTVGNVWDSEIKSSNNIYVLDENLQLVSEIEDIAPGEKIYSARFMGKKAYLVTFKKIDPFFTIDLSDPYNPKILGKLKIPGYSDYLHPFDENHIIGFGKDTVEALDSLKESRNLDFAWYQGLKIALFDVSDFENPKELAKIIIGDRGTDSPALHNHKAFLFNREKELLVIPVQLCQISDEIKEQNNGYTGNIYGDFTFQGVYVYKLSLENGFEYKGRITHLQDDDILKSGYYGYWGSSSIVRSLYIGDILYTISDNMIKMNSLEDLSEINSIKLP